PTPQRTIFSVRRSLTDAERFTKAGRKQGYTALLGDHRRDWCRCGVTQALLAYAMARCTEDGVELVSR
ncbi:MAG: hypothetical protein Q4P21_14025, partial [Arthrobacter sp.]|nr:hypothetical protein [Arthrobacter sp.]